MEKYPNESNYYKSSSDVIKNNKYILKNSRASTSKENIDDDSDLSIPINVFPKIFPLLLTFKKAPRVSKVIN